MLKERAGRFTRQSPSNHAVLTVVYLCLLPALMYIQSGAVSLLTRVGLRLPSAATLQLVADVQMHRFRAAHSRAGSSARRWKHSRHPNYLGELPTVGRVS